MWQPLMRVSALTWVGCAVLPAGNFPNVVAALPHDGLAVSSFFDPTDAKFAEKMTAGQASGKVLIGDVKKGWRTSRR